MTDAKTIPASRIKQHHRRAWAQTKKALDALDAYACAAEDHEQPCMSDDAIDAAELAAKIRRYDHRFPA